MKNLVKNTILALSLLFAVGCTRESLSDCAPATNVGLIFSFTMNVSGEDIFAKEVANLDVFVFNSDGVLVHIERAMGPFRKDYCLNFNLPTDIYTFVAWGGLSESYQARESDAEGRLSDMKLNKSTLKDMRMIVEGEKSVINTKLNPLFHGIVSGVSVREDGRVESRISLMKNISAVYTKVVGLGAPKSESVELYYTGANSCYDFYNEFSPQAVGCKYMPYNTNFVENSLSTEIVLQRLKIDQPLILNIVRGRTPLYHVDFPQLLLDIEGNGINSQEDLDRHDIYNVTIDLSGVPFQVTITINGWKIVKILGEME